MAVICTITCRRSSRLRTHFNNPFFSRRSTMRVMEETSSPCRLARSTGVLASCRSQLSRIDACFEVRPVEASAWSCASVNLATSLGRSSRPTKTERMAALDVLFCKPNHYTGWGNYLSMQVISSSQPADHSRGPRDSREQRRSRINRRGHRERKGRRK